MATGMCPNCGTPRMGSFRFCRSCGLDYDSATPDASTPTPAILAPAPEAAPAVPPSVEPDDVQRQPVGDVIVVQVRHLKLLGGVIGGGIIGMLLAGAVVVPLFGEEGVLLGSLAGIVTVVVSAWLGLRLVRSTARRRPAVGSEDPG